MGLGNLINLYRVQKLYSLLRKAKDNPKRVNDIKWWKEVANTALAIKEIQEMFKALQGYKSYIIAAIIAVLAGLHAMGYIDEATYQTLLALLGAGAIGTVSAKIGRIQSEINDRVNINKK